MPFAVAVEKGYFKDFKADVTGILSSDRGGTTIRNLLGGKLAYGEAAVSAVVSAVQSGADLKIISGNVHTVAESTVRNLLDSEKKGGVPYWGAGELRIDTMNNMIRAQKLVGAFKGDVDWSKLIDESFLPDDLRSKKPR